MINHINNKTLQLNGYIFFLVLFISVSIMVVNSEPIQIFAQTVSIENDNKTKQEYVNNILFISGTAIEKENQTW